GAERRELAVEALAPDDLGHRGREVAVPEPGELLDAGGGRGRHVVQPGAAHGEGAEELTGAGEGGIVELRRAGHRRRLRADELVDELVPGTAGARLGAGGVDPERGAAPEAVDLSGGGGGGHRTVFIGTNGAELNHAGEKRSNVPPPTARSAHPRARVRVSVRVVRRRPGPRRPWSL